LPIGRKITICDQLNADVIRNVASNQGVSASGAFEMNKNLKCC